MSAPCRFLPFPRSDLYRDQLLWTIRVMRDDDPDIGFAASLLAYAINKDGLTSRQQRYALPLIARLRAEAEAARPARRNRRPAGAPPRITIQ